MSMLMRCTPNYVDMYNPIRLAIELSERLIMSIMKALSVKNMAMDADRRIRTRSSTEPTTLITAIAVEKHVHLVDRYIP